MPRLAIDHNLDERIVAGLIRRKPDVDLLRIRDAGLATTSDQVVLAWAARAGRVLITHDRTTLLGLAYERVVMGEPMSGVIAVSDQHPIGGCIDDLILLLECTPDSEWAGRVYFVPL